MRDFFISYTSADENWAEWLGWQLEEAGYSVLIQAWDFKAGQNFVLAMHQAAAECQKTIAVLSPNYLQALYTQPEWAAAFVRDPTGAQQKLIPVRVQPCDLQGLQTAVVYIDLVGLNADEAKARLLAKIKTERAKPATEPLFPGAVKRSERSIRMEPDYPGVRRSAIKGLRPFTAEDAELFLQLQRRAELADCLAAITDPEFRLGILFGESGCGKTSFLQAGLMPMLSASRTHRPVYVKFSNQDPILTLQQALADQAELGSESIEPVLFLTLMTRLAGHPHQTLVLLFDQFEQFFVHGQRSEQRQPLIALLTDWYQNGAQVPVKILFSLRDDFYARQVELQQALGYSLGPQDSFPLRKFTPGQASEIFKVIAETESLAYDEKFIREMTEQDLAHKDDGLISPVDIQILSWMISAQRQPGAVVFNRKYYQKMGGIEGLLENYLGRALSAVAQESQRQVVFKVLLSLIDEQVRAGVLNLAEIQAKLAGDAGAAAVEQAVAWLAQSKVRLITPVRRGEGYGYELAHERLIPPVRKLTHQHSSAVEQANRLLDRRTNEWLGNDRDGHYLLRWRELGKIKRQKNFLIWGELEKAKKELLALSRKRRQRQAYAAGIGLILVVLMASFWSNINNSLIEPRRRAARIQALKAQFVPVKGDTFEMGDLWGEGGEDERPVHKVLLSDFAISQYEITNQQYCDFLNSIDSAAIKAADWLGMSSAYCQIRMGANGRFFVRSGGYERHPVVTVSWHGAAAFCAWLGGRLPTEAEWEFAARSGGKKIKYPWGDDEPDTSKANYGISLFAVKEPKPVGSYPENKLGLFDMAGNAWELCADWYDENYYQECLDDTLVIDPKGPAEGEARVCRGGSWYDSEDCIRTADRYNYYPLYRNYILGFRCVR